MCMWGKMLASLRKSLSFQLNSIKHRSQVDNTVSANAENLVALPVQFGICNACIEDSKQCSCDNIIVEDKNLPSKEGVDVEHDANANANSSFVHAVINMVGMLIGLGQLSTPYAVEKGGWASTLLLMGLGVMCAYTCHILGKCLEKNPKLTSYVDIGNQAFGAKGRFLAATFMYMEIFMSLISYTIALHDNLITLFLGMHLNSHLANFSISQLLTAVAVFISLPSLWIRDLSSISFLSTGGIILSLAVFMCVVATAICGGAHANSINNHSIPVFNLHNIPSVSGLYVFGYGGHVVFPDLYKAMKDPSKFTKVSIVSFTIVTVLYTSLGLMGANMYGIDVKSQITLNMPPKHIVTKIAVAATVVTPMTKYALEFTPMAIQLEQVLPNYLSGRTKLMIRGCVASFSLLIILTIALSVPYFEQVLSLTGSLVSAAICLIFPCVFYMKICWGQIPKPFLVLNLSLAVFGFFLGVMGTISSLRLILKKIQSHHSI